MCDKNPGCSNSKNLVLDTNFLDQAHRTIIPEIYSYGSRKSIEEQSSIFLTRAQEIIKKIGRCGDGHVFTSENIYGDEIDISKMDSARDFSEVYETGIKIEELTEMEVRAFQDILSEDVGFADAGLVLLRLKLLQNQEAIVITDDLKLRKEIEDLK